MNNITILDLYTIIDGEVVHLASSGERSRYFIGNDYTICHHGSGGAELSDYTYYKIDINNKRLSTLECVLFDSRTDKSNPYFYGSGNFTEYDSSTMKHITKNEAEHIIDSHESEDVLFEVNLFSNYNS